MSIKITLDIFSGRPNPSWTLTNEQYKGFKSELSNLTEKTHLKTPVTYYGLGYRGFIIETFQENELPDSILINADLIDFGRQQISYKDKNHHLELWLLNTAGNLIDTKLKEIIQNSILDDKNSIDFLIENLKVEIPAPTIMDYWWDSQVNKRREKNNCYNYACNLATYTFAQPGRRSGQIFSQFLCDDVKNAALRDGLRHVTHVRHGNEHSYVALVIAPNQDFHWYRRNNDGLWAHKPGQTMVTNLDNSGNLIRDPRTATRGFYSEFCGYFEVLTDTSIC